MVTKMHLQSNFYLQRDPKTTEILKNSRIPPKMGVSVSVSITTTSHARKELDNRHHVNNPLQFSVLVDHFLNLL
jgi:hypothetical protein